MNGNQKLEIRNPQSSAIKIRGDFRGMLIIGICLLLPIALIYFSPKLRPLVERVAPFCIFIGFIGAVMILYSIPICCKSLTLDDEKVIYTMILGKSEISLHDLNYVLQGTAIGRGRGGYKLLFSKRREPANRYEVAFSFLSARQESDTEEATITILGYEGGEFGQGKLLAFLKVLKQRAPHVKIDEDVILRLEGKVDEVKLAKALGGGNPSIRPPL